MSKTLIFRDEGLPSCCDAPKPDQEGEGRYLGITPGLDAETCSLRALRIWFMASGIQTGVLIRRIGRSGV